MNILTGTCSFCNSVLSKKDMVMHLQSCQKRNGLMSQNENKVIGRSFDLLVEGRYNPEYWLYLEVQTKTTLKRLDVFLRKIWLECCGHLSAFSIKDKRFVSYADELDEDEETMNIALEKAVSLKTKFFYEYDFGTTTELALTVVSEKKSNFMNKSIQLLARNNILPITCETCKNLAVQVCVFCVSEGKGWVCNQCIKKHKCEEQAFLPVVNSPRVGQCAYTG